MKKLFLLFSALALAVSAQAQTYSPLTIASGYPTVLAANSATTLASSVVFDVRKQKDVAVMLRWVGLDTGSNGVVSFTFARGVDGSTFETLAAKRTVIAIASTGAATNVCITNIPSYGAGFIKLISLANDDSAGLTNIVIKEATKIGAP